jgi:ribosomal protein S11
MDKYEELANKIIDIVIEQIHELYPDLKPLPEFLEDSENASILYGVAYYDTECQIADMLRDKFETYTELVKRRKEKSEKHKIWNDINSDYTNDENITHIDGYESSDVDAEGFVIALVKSNGDIEYKDDRAKTDKYAQEVINEVVERKKKKEQEDN